jgi:hemerythrin-like domain-containing protein
VLTENAEGADMLTLTYALVALSVEQKKVLGRLLELQHEIQQKRSRKVVADQRQIESLLAQFVQLDEACRNRNIELYVLPAIRAATTENDSLLADIEALTAMGRIILATVRERLRQAFAQGSFNIEDVCNSLELYCQHLLKRLAIEDMHFMPLAQRVISSDEWFDIAAQFISHESEKQTKKTFDHMVPPAETPSHIAAVNQSNSDACQAVI